jgi:hypothetical protein
MPLGYRPVEDWLVRADGPAALVGSPTAGCCLPDWSIGVFRIAVAPGRGAEPVVLLTADVTWLPWL